MHLFAHCSNAYFSEVLLRPWGQGLTYQGEVCRGAQRHWLRDPLGGLPMSSSWSSRTISHRADMEPEGAGLHWPAPKLHLANAGL